MKLDKNKIKSLLLEKGEESPIFLSKKEKNYLGLGEYERPILVEKGLSKLASKGLELHFSPQVVDGQTILMYDEC